MNTGAPMNDFSLRIAQRHIEAYSSWDHDLMAQHRDAMECRACEEFLDAGIAAYKWLKHADETIREAARQGFEVSAETVETLKLLYRQWCVPCRHANKLIADQKANGFSIRNLREFEEAWEAVQSQVQRQKDYEALNELMQGQVFDTGFWQEAARLRSERS